MIKNSYLGKFTPHHFQKKDWFYSVEGKAILPRKNGAGFIVFDSLDGAGNSTQVKLLADYLNKKKGKVQVTKEPTSGLIGGLIKSQLTHDWKSSPQCLQLLFAADRAYHLEKEVIPLLKRGINVISDRYFFSTIAYGAVDISDFDWLVSINKPFLIPDLTFFLRVSPKICLKRILETRFEINLFEKEKTLEKVWRSYEKIAERFDGVFIIDGQREISEIAKQIRKIVKAELKL